MTYTTVPGSCNIQETLWPQKNEVLNSIPPLGTHFQCYPWHCPSNLQTIMQTSSPSYCQTGTFSHQCSELNLENSCHSYSVQMCPLVLGAVAGVTESLLTAWMLAQIRLLTRVTPQVNFKIFEPWKCLLATFKLWKENNLGVVKKDLGCLNPGKGGGRVSLLCANAKAKQNFLK